MKQLTWLHNRMKLNGSISYLLTALILLIAGHNYVSANYTLPPSSSTLSQKYTVPGTYTFTVPEGVTSITVETWGGGGRGGSRTSSSDGTGGGGGGAYSRHVLTVTPGQSYVVTVGAGSTSNTTPGGDSWVSISNLANAFVLAKGGESVPNNNNSGGDRGEASGGIGSTRRSGGDGANRVNSTSSGGGGSSAGPNSNGVNASGTTGGVAPTGGGNGGNGRTSIGIGNPGSFPGGGGGGAVRGSSGSPSGGSGGHGQIIISYTYNIDAGQDQSQCQNALFSVNTTTPPSGYTATWSIISGQGYIHDNSKLNTTVVVRAGFSATVRLTITNGTVTATDDVVLTNTTSCTPVCNSPTNDNGDLELSGSISDYNLSFQSTPAALIYQNTNPIGWSGVYGANSPNTTSFTGAYHIHKTGANGNPHSGSKMIYLAGDSFGLSGFKTGNQLPCGKSYKLSVWVAAYTNGGTQSNAPFLLEFFSGGDNVPDYNISHSGLAPASTSWDNLNWQRYSFEFTIPTSGYEWSDFVFTTLSATNGIVIDDVCIEEVFNGSAANAGPDVFACSGNFTMAANTPSSGYSGNWSVIAGNVSITNPTSPSTNVTFDSGSVARLQWSVTSTGGNNTILALDPKGEGGFENCCNEIENGWTSVNNSTNQWHIGSASYPYSGNRAAYISNNGGTSYVYTNTVSQTSHLYRDITVPPNATNLNLSFKWKGSGESGQDRLLVYTAPISVTPVEGTPASNSTTLSGATLISSTSLHSSDNYQTENITLPNALADSTFRLIFTWQNNASGGTTTPTSIDEVSFGYQLPACTSNDEINIAYTSGGTFSVNNDTICDGETSLLTALNCIDGQILWSTGDTTTSISVEPLITTEYSVTCTPNNSANLLLNPGFESETDLQFWQNWDNASITTTPANVYEGTKAVQINTVGQSWGGVAQVISSEPGIRYKISFYAKTTSTNLIPALRYQFYNNTTLIEEVTGPKITSTDYQIYEYEIVSPPNTTSLTLLAEIGGGGELYIDNWEVFQYTECTQVANATVIVGDFNRVRNHEIDNALTEWSLNIETGSSATVSADNTSQLSGINSARVNITSASGTGQHIQFVQTNQTLQAGKIYELKFKAKASANRVISAFVDLGQSPWTSYHNQNINLTTSDQTFYIPFTQTETTSLGRVGFNLGQSTQTVWIDSISLVEKCILWEICDNGIDDDLDGFTDCFDSDCGYSTGNFMELNFESSSPPVLVSGVAKTKGSVYRFSNISAGVDALVTVDSVSNVLVFEEIFHIGLSQRIRGVPNNNPYVDYTIQLVQAGTSNPITPVDLFLSSFDIDGINDVNMPYSDYVTYFGINEFFALSDNSKINAINLGNQTYRFEVTPTGNIYPDDTTGINPDYGIGVVYTSVNSFQLRIGINGPYTGNDVRTTLVSGLNSQIQYFSDMSCSSVEVCDNGIDDDNDGLIDCDDPECGCCHLFLPVIDGSSQICFGTPDPIELSVDIGETFLWSTGATTRAITVAPIIQTTYTVTVTNITGCVKIIQKIVDVEICGGSMCFFGNNEVYADVNWSIIYDTIPSEDKVRIRTIFSKNFVDNTYGTGAIGWPGGQQFEKLVSSDHLIIALYNGNNIKIMEIKMDYIDVDASTPSGYGSLGINGGSGSMLFGNPSDVVDVETSLDRNFNHYGYVLPLNSPATNNNYDPDPLYPHWIYDTWYEAEVKLSAFGESGFGTVHINGIHASPSKTGNNTEYVSPGNCCVLSPVITGDTLACPGDTTTLGVHLLVNSSEQVDASDDTYISEEKPGKNFGSCKEMKIGLKSSLKQRGLLKFDLTSIPADAIIIGANLLLTKVSGSNVPATVHVHPLISTWNENSGGCTGNDLTPNWTNRNTTTSWTTSGGDFGASIASQTVSTNGVYSWNLLSTVEDWINDSSTNYGILIKTTEDANYEYLFGSSEHNTSANRPVLNVTYLGTPGVVSYLWSNGATTSTINVSQDSTSSYIVSVTAPGTCDVAVAQKTIRVLYVDDAADISICPGTNTQLNLNITGDPGPYTYVWSPSTGLSATNIANPYASPSASTTYTVTITGTDGCTVTTTRTVNVLDIVNASISGSSTICTGGNINLTGAGGQNYFWNTGATSQNISVSSSGTYSVTVTNNSNCTSVASKTVSLNPGLSLTIQSSGGPCLIENSELTVNPVGGSNNYTYNWSGPSGFSGNQQTVSITENGNYYVTVSDDIGCVATGNTFVYDYFEPFIVSINSVICEGDSVTMDVNAASAVSFQWSANAGNATTQMVTVYPTLPSSTYYVTVTNDVGCTGVPAITIDVNPKPVISVTGPDEICVEDTTSVSPATGGTWISTNPDVAIINNSGLVTGISGGTTTLIFTDSATNCSSEPSVPVIVHPKPNAIITGLNNICVGDSTLVTPTTGGTWVSSNSSVATVTNEGIIYAISTGTATFTFTNETTLCSSNASLPVNVSSLPEVNISGPGTLCLNTNIALTNNFPGGIWSSSNPDVAFINNSGIVSAYDTGSVTIYYDFVSGPCIGQAIKELYIYENPSVQWSGSDEICVGQTTSVTPNTGGVWVSSNPGVATIDNNGLITALQSGYSSFTFQHSTTMCMSEPSTALTVLTKPSITLSGPSVICVGNQTTLLPFSNGTWQSSNPGVAGITNGGVVTGISEGSAYFTYTHNETGCTSDPSIPVEVGSVPSATIDFQGSVCLTDTSTISVIPSGGVPEYTYSWVGPLGFTGNTNEVSITNNGMYYVTVTDSYGCKANASGYVYQRFDPYIVNLNTTVCDGQSVPLSVNASSPASYLWSPNAGSATTSQVNVLPTFPSSIYYVTVTNTTGCQAVAQANINVTLKPVIAISGPDSICTGQTTNMSPSTGGVWVSLNPSRASITNAGLVTAFAGGTARFLFSNSSTGCTSDTSAIIQINGSSTISIQGPSTICQGAQTQLLPASGGTWTAIHPTIAIVNGSGTVFGLSQGTAQFSYANSDGCTSSGTISISVHSKPTIVLDGLSQICVGSTTRFLPSSGGTWTSSNSSIASITNAGNVSGISEGSVRFVYTSTFTGCPSDSSAIITIVAGPAVSITGPNTICVGNTTTLSPTSGGSWVSNSPSIATVNSSGVVTGLSQGNVTFTFTSSTTGCPSMPTGSVTVNARPIAILTGPSGICIGATTTLSPTSGGTWVSSNPARATVTNGGLVTGVSAGLVNFTFTNTTTGCISLPSGNVTVHPRPNISLNSTSICIGGTTTLQPSTGGVWTSSNPSVATSTNSGIVTGIGQGVANFIFTANNTGCSSNPSANLTVLPKPSTSITGPSEICQGFTTQLNPTTGGTWSSLQPSIASVNNAGLVTGLLNGTAQFVFTSNQGCASDPTNQVVIHGKPAYSFIGPPNICVGTTLQVNPTSGGNWVSTDPGTASINSSGLITGILPGSVRFIFTNTTTGCVSDTTSFVLVNLPPTVSRVGSSQICIGQTSQLTPTTGGTWVSLSPGVATVSNSGLITGIGEGTGHFKFTQSTTGCETTLNNAVTVLPRPSITLVGSSSICIGGSTQFLPSSGGTWASLNPSVATIDNSGIVTGISQGLASFVFTSQSTGCPSSTSSPVTVIAKPTLVLNGPQSICVGGNTQFLPSSGGTWTSSNPMIAEINNQGLVTGIAQGNASFIFTDTSTGCTSNASINITVNPSASLSVAGSTNICLGYNTTLSASTSGLWYSTRPGIASTTSNGLVKGLAPGKVTFYFVEAASGCITYLPNDVVSVSNCIDPDFNVTMVNVPVTGNVSTNDEVPTGTTYLSTVFLISKPTGSVASLSMNLNGTYTFQGNMPGKYTYNVMVCLPSMTTNCPVSTLVFKVINPNTESENIVPNMDVIYSYENQNITINTVHNDVCLSGLNCQIDETLISIVDNPGNGFASVQSNGNILYIPNPNFVGMDTLVYEICASDNPSNCAVASQFITVMAQNANNSLSTTDDFYPVYKGQTLSQANLINNDFDPEGGLVTINPAGDAQNPVSIPSGSYYITPAGELNFTPNVLFSGTVDIIYTVCDQSNFCINATAHVLVLENLTLRIRAYLEGALIENANAKASDNRPLMRDNLRMSPYTGTNYLPSLDPYTNPMTFFDLSSIYAHVGNGNQSQFTNIANPTTVFAVTGQNAIVDWVYIELRSKNDNALILGTRSALIQRDGDVVDLDGISPVEFPGIRVDSCYVVLRHRNHFGVMSMLVSTSDLLDFTSPLTPTFDYGTSRNDGYDYTGLAQKDDVSLGYKSMWAGDFDSNGRIKFVNPNDDQNMLFFEVLSFPTNADFMANYNFSFGYLQADYDLNSKSKYDNPGDDKNMLFYQVLFHPLNVNFISNFNFITEQVPPAHE